MRKPTRQLVITYRVLDKETVKHEITDFITENPKCTTSQIISKLRISPEQIAEALEELEREGVVSGRVVG